MDDTEPLTPEEEREACWPGPEPAAAAWRAWDAAMGTPPCRPVRPRPLWASVQLAMIAEGHRGHKP
jgi:hypothetical protein